MASASPDFRYEVLTKQNWYHFEKLFGERGACGGCWCMTHRLKTAEFNEQKGAGNKQTHKDLVWKGNKTGLLLFCEKEAIAWISIAPREEFIKIENSRIYKRIDDLEVFSITCFFIRKDLRRMGISKELIKATIAYARDSGIKILEAYPIIPYNNKIPDAFAWTGKDETFDALLHLTDSPFL